MLVRVVYSRIVLSTGTIIYTTPRKRFNSIKMLVPAIMICLVGSTFACSQYTNSVVVLNYNYNFLTEELAKNESYSVNYVSMLVAMFGMGYAATDGLSYDDAYTQYPGLLILGKEFPTQAVDIMSTKINEYVPKTQSIVALVNETCGSEVSEDCDCKVEEAIKDDPKLQAQGDLLIAEGTSKWASYQDAWIEAAKNDSVSDYLAANKDALVTDVLTVKKTQFTLLKYIGDNGYSD